MISYKSKSSQNLPPLQSPPPPYTTPFLPKWSKCSFGKLRPPPATPGMPLPSPFPNGPIILNTRFSNQEEWVKSTFLKKKFFLDTKPQYKKLLQPIFQGGGAGRVKFGIWGYMRWETCAGLGWSFPHLPKDKARCYKRAKPLIVMIMKGGEKSLVKKKNTFFSVALPSIGRLA